MFTGPRKIYVILLVICIMDLISVVGLPLNGLNSQHVRACFDRDVPNVEDDIRCCVPGARRSKAPRAKPGHRWFTNM